MYDTTVGIGLLLNCPEIPCAFSKAVRPEKLAAHLFEVDEDVEKDEVSPCVGGVASSCAKAHYYRFE